MKRAEKHLLEALYGHISSLGKFESDTLMEEDPDVMQRRAATKKVCLHTSSLLLCRSECRTQHLKIIFTPYCELALVHKICTMASIYSLVLNRSVRLAIG